MSGAIDPVTLQVLAGALRAACEEMGAVLVHAAHSANIKERRDCSTALFDAAGELVMQAEHIPVHLGSMPDAVAAVLGEDHRPGESWILNDPYRGGTHLPDITLISPVFFGDELLGFAASRAHHADVGGPTAGGMPIASLRLEDEGIVIPPTRASDEVLRELAARMRDPRQRLADLRAQRAANRVGAERLGELCRRYGETTLRRGMAAVLDYAERRTRARIAELPDGSYGAEDVLEDDARGAERDLRLRVTATIASDRLRLDFTGTDPQIEGNLNCPLAVTKSASFFAVRVLTDPDAPPSAGAHRPIEVVAPPGSLLNARPPAAVAAGNVETSSRVADLVMAALAKATPAPAQGQGTMNNLTLAGEGFTYYETIAGGQGACPDADGPSAVHVAMSNTLNTPIEALETELPVRVRELALRRGSGGEGRHRGGDGVVRELEALAPMSFTLISERRRHAPRGADGGSDGARGRNLLNGELLPAKAAGELHPGDRLRIETPGGGGHGPSERGRQLAGMDRILLDDGVQLALSEAGEGPTVVFVHGLGGSSYAWLPVLRLCAEAGFHAIAYDQRGAGLSSKPPGPYSVERWAEDLVGLLDARGLRQAALVGNSVGGIVAQRAALILGERCLALAMVGSVLEWAPAARAVFAERERLAREGRMDEIAAAVAETALSERCRAASPALHSLFAAMVAANDPDAYAESCAATARAKMEAPQRVRCAALALCGELDRVTPPEAARAIAATMPRCRADLIPGAAHWCQVEAPEAVAEAIVGLLAQAC